MNGEHILSTPSTGSAAKGKTPTHVSPVLSSLKDSGKDDAGKGAPTTNKQHLANFSSTFLVLYVHLCFFFFPSRYLAPLCCV